MTTPQRIAQLARAQAVLELAALGASVAEIAAVLEVPDEVVRRILVREERALHALDEETRERHRKLQVDRLEDLLLAHWPTALQGNARNANVVLKTLARQSALLGLDAPARSEVETTVSTRLEPDLGDYSTAELEALERALEDAKGELIDVEPVRALPSGEKIDGGERIESSSPHGGSGSDA